MTRVLTVILAVYATIAPVAAAEKVLSPSEFEAFSENTTLFFDRKGVPYGAEQYQSGRRVIWTFLDGQCQYGTWFPQGDGICFLYEGQTNAQCWHFLETERGKAVRVIGDDPANDLSVTAMRRKNLECPGPKIGVRYEF